MIGAGGKDAVPGSRWVKLKGKCAFHVEVKGCSVVLSLTVKGGKGEMSQFNSWVQPGLSTQPPHISQTLPSIISIEEDVHVSTWIMAAYR